MAVSDYNNYIVNLIDNVIIDKNLELNIYLDLDNKKINFPVNVNYKNLFIGMNYEHTLVKQNAPNEYNNPIGVIYFNMNDKYTVRIHNYDRIKLNDIVIDYSLPNIYNVKSSNQFLEFESKHIYIAPCIYEDIYISIYNRNINTLTTFIHIDTQERPRRKSLLDIFNKAKTDHVNISNCFDKKNLQDIYRNTKILINIHQTDYHDTFEELRCLPALFNGVIVISETSPLHKLVPYNELIIWCEYDNIFEKTKEVLNNYEKYYSSIFTANNINILKNLHINNIKNIEEKLLINHRQ